MSGCRWWREGLIERDSTINYLSAECCFNLCSFAGFRPFDIISLKKNHINLVFVEQHTHRNTCKTYFSDLILTSRSVPWEVEEIFGAGDGDHLSDVGAGPAGDLVPRPTATCSRAEQQNQRDKHHKRMTQNNFFFLNFLLSVNVWLKLLWGDKEQAALSPGVPMAANVIAQVSWVNSSGWPELTRCQHD